MNRFSAHHRPRSPAAFTLIEALISISITGMAASVLLLGIGGSLQTTSDALHETIARGMAQQLMDEVLGGRYAAVGAGGRQWPLAPSAIELANPGRQFDDIDDYHLQSVQPPQDPWGVELGKDDGQGDRRCPNFWAPTVRSDDGRQRTAFFQDWRQEVDVYYVDKAAPAVRLPAGKVSDYRAVEVRIIEDNPDTGPRELVKLRRVVAYVPPI